MPAQCGQGPKWSPKAESLCADHLSWDIRVQALVLLGLGLESALLSLDFQAFLGLSLARWWQCGTCQPS